MRLNQAKKSDVGNEKTEGNSHAATLSSPAKTLADAHSVHVDRGRV